MRHTLLIACMTLSPAALAASDYYYHCSDGNDIRSIAVVYKDTPAATPCTVHYHKRGDDRLLWQATTQKHYCEAKAERFAKELRLHGFVCERREGKVAR